jgi:PRC-barrel domain
MIDLYSGRVAYAVPSFGGFLNMGNKLFAVPWEALTVDTIKKEFILKMDRSRLERHRDSIKITGRTWQIPPLVPRYTATTG